MSYDYVIVGAGSAGCVLANRLSEDPDISVLVLEAGPPDTSDFVHIPAAFSALFRSQHDWDHSTVWEPYLNNRRVYLPRGRMLGGSSSMNAMVYIRGSRVDYDEWRDEHGCAGWGYDDLLPYFKRAEDNVRGADDYHGVGGPLHVEEGKARSRLCEAWLEAAVASGQEENPDFNGARQEGFGWYQTTTKDGVRHSCATAYLRPAMERPNVTVETHVQALRILFEGRRAVGVEGLRLSDVLEFRAEREVIVCGGAYNSPQLLMLSGLGRAPELEMLQIPMVAEVPEVGLNLQDHANAGLVFETDEEISLFDTLNDENLATWQAGDGGPLSSTIAETGGFVHTRDGLPAPDVQFHLVPALFQAEGLVPGDGHGFTGAECVLKPKSRGQVAIASPDPTAKPLILHNYYDHPDDLASAVAGVRMLMEFAGQDPIASLRSGDRTVPASDRDEDIVEHIRRTTQTLYHPTSTCRMGADDQSVVDTELRVRGVEGLRVVDASVMPTVPRGNTNAPTIAVAEKAADVIRGREAPAPAEAALTPATP